MQFKTSKNNISPYIYRLNITRIRYKLYPIFSSILITKGDLVQLGSIRSEDCFSVRTQQAPDPISIYMCVDTCRSGVQIRAQHLSFLNFPQFPYFLITPVNLVEFSLKLVNFIKNFLIFLKDNFDLPQKCQIFLQQLK